LLSGSILLYGDELDGVIIEMMKGTKSQPLYHTKMMFQHDFFNDKYNAI